MSSRFARSAALAASVLALSSAYAGTAHAFDPPRVRFGLSGAGGGFVGHVGGGMGGIEPRIGIQINNLFGVYVQSQWMLGGIVADRYGTNFAGFAFNQLMGDLTFFNMLQVGVGPSLDFIWGCNASNGQAACADAGPYFGLNGRLAVVIGGGEPHRSGFVLSLDVHPTILRGDAVTAFLFGLGGELY